MDFINAKEAQAYLKTARLRLPRVERSENLAGASQTKHRRVISRAIFTLSEAGWDLSIERIELEFVKPRGIIHYKSDLISIVEYPTDRVYTESGFVSLHIK